MSVSKYSSVESIPLPPDIAEPGIHVLRVMMTLSGDKHHLVETI
jgi:hypothetical protein